MYMFVTVLAALVLTLLRRRFRSRRLCLDPKRLDGKTVLITGGASGIGKETAIALARRGARVHITSHDDQKGEAALRHIKKESASMNIRFWNLNLADLQSIRNFCKEFLKNESRLDVLINNDVLYCHADLWPSMDRKQEDYVREETGSAEGAIFIHPAHHIQEVRFLHTISGLKVEGNVTLEHAHVEQISRCDVLRGLVLPFSVPAVLAWTDNGFSMCFGVNHLGPFLLTNLLLERLKSCSPSRIVNVTSNVHKYQKLDFADLNYNIVPLFTYCRSKLANVYFTQEIARQMERHGVTACAVHPGYVAGDWTSQFSILFRIVMYVITSVFFISCQAASQTVIYCAISDDILQHNGGFFSDCKPCKLRPFVKDAGIAKKLWEASEAMVGLTSSAREHLATRRR